VTGSFRQELARGDVLVITGHRAHGYEKTQGLNLVNILIRYELLPRIGRELSILPGYHALFGDAARRQPFVSHMRLSASEYPQVEEWADRLEIETHQPGQAGHLLAEAYLTLILGVLCRCYGRSKAARIKPEAKFSVMLSEIEKRFDQPLRMAELARLAGMSERSFFRHFPLHLGMTPVQYLLKVRLQHASERLVYGGVEKRISEIAQACGFEDSNYFSRVFRESMGMSPREYRRRNLRLETSKP
jgi:AraC-like DNA-binding protein